MSGLHEVDCSGCGRRHVTSGEQARKLRVLRCECGHFVRLDRALAERRSEPTPPPVELPSAGADALDEEDDATRMMSTLAAAAALNERARARATQASMVDDGRSARPAQREGSQRPSAPAPARPRQPSIAPAEKPLWYVDLGGTELVEMTIEQLIIARRTGKLGEGALVWREGMPSWRPVGTLIPAASASSHPAPLATPSTAPAPSTPPIPTRPPPAAAIRTPLPSRAPPGKSTPAPRTTQEEPTPQSLASYERPLATLEFALEKAEPAPVLGAPRSPFPSLDSSAQPSTRPPAPLSRASFASLASLSSPLSTPFARAPQLPRVASPAASAPAARPSPPPPPVPLATLSPIPVVTAVRSSERPNEQALTSLQIADVLSERPRWVSACIALVVCVTASAAGASLVRSLKQARSAQALPTSPATAPSINTPVSTPAAQPPPTASSATPLVVDLESLSVEHKRSAPRAPRAIPKLVPTESAESSEETPPKASESAPESAAPETPNSSDVPPAARSNPYGSGSLIDQIKKATADEESGQ